MKKLIILILTIVPLFSFAQEIKNESQVDKTEIKETKFNTSIKSNQQKLKQIASKELGIDLNYVSGYSNESEVYCKLFEGYRNFYFFKSDLEFKNIRIWKTGSNLELDSFIKKIKDKDYKGLQRIK